MMYQPHPALVEYERKILADPEVQGTIKEFTEIIRAQYPDATFDVGFTFDSMDVLLKVTVDVDDTEEVERLYQPQLFKRQLEEGLPLMVITVQPIERTTEMLRQRREAAAAGS